MNIVFIPGLLCTNRVWGHVNDIRKTYDCYDADVFNHDRIEDMANNLIAHLPSGSFGIVGISMGGYVAIDVALKKINNLKKMILINTTSKPVNPDTILERESAIKLAEKGEIESIINSSQGYCYFEPKAEWLALEKEMGLEIGAKAYIKQQRAIISRKDYSDELSNINVETLIISGKEDKVLPCRDSIYLSDNIPNSRLILLNKCGHLSTLERGKAVLNYINEFLEN